MPKFSHRVVTRRAGKSGLWRPASEHIQHDDGAGVFERACKLGCEGIVSKRRGSRYARGRSSSWIKVKNPDAPAVRREREEHWGG